MNNIEYCKNGKVHCKPNYILSGKQCALNGDIVRMANEVEFQSKQLLSELKGKHECNNYIDNGLNEEQLKSLINIEKPEALDEVFNYFKNEMLPQSSFLTYDGKKYQSLYSYKTLTCEIKLWFLKNNMRILGCSCVVLIFIIILLRFARQKYYESLANNVISQIYNILDEQLKMNEEKAIIPVERLKQHLQPIHNITWHLVKILFLKIKISKNQ